MNWRFLFAASLFSLASCGGNGDTDIDTDGDGLTDAEEEQLGLDINNPDSDGDGLDDGMEVNDLHSDPLSTDGDGDGYLDFDEVNEGSDPADAESKIYKGGWPYNAGKSELEESDVPATVQVGDLFMHFTAKDQFTDTVDVWDFKNDEGKYIIVDVSAQWCGPCNAVSLWLDGGLSDWDADGWNKVREGVESGDVYWITVLGENDKGDKARQYVTEEWYAEYPNPNIAILADTDYFTVDFLKLSSWPTVVILNPDMTVAWAATGDEYWVDGMEWIKNKI